MKKEDANNDVIADARRHMEIRANTYRERALKMYPWVCGSCGREFGGKKLKELTVHHKDHDHDNNPADGIPVPADKFGRRVNNNIHPKINGPAKIGGGKGAVHNQRYLMAASQVCQRL